MGSARVVCSRLWGTVRLLTDGLCLRLSLSLPLLLHYSCFLQSASSFDTRSVLPYFPKSFTSPRASMQAPGRTPYRTDPMRAPVSATTPSHTQLQSQSPTARSPLRRRPLACVRCRRRKVRCDGAVPACSNCAKAGEECFEGRAASAVSRRFVMSQRREPTS